MSRDELVERFTLERVGKSAAVFDYDKLKHLNGVYLRALPPEEYADRLVAYLREQGYDWDEQLVRRAAPLVQEKIATLGEFPEFAGFLFARPEPAAAADGAVLPAAAEALEQVEPFEAEPIEAALRRAGRAARAQAARRVSADSSRADRIAGVARAVREPRAAGQGGVARAHRRHGARRRERVERALKLEPGAATEVRGWAGNQLVHRETFTIFE